VAVEFGLTIAGDVTRVDKQAVTARLAVQLGVPASTIEVTVVAASVRLTVVVTFTDHPAAQLASDTIQSSSAAVLSTSLGLAVQTVSAPILYELTLPPPSAPPSAPAAGGSGLEAQLSSLAAGVGGLAIVTLGAACLVRRRRHRRPDEASVHFVASAGAERTKLTTGKASNYCLGVGSHIHDTQKMARI